jgi:hypothetical protein
LQAEKDVSLAKTPSTPRDPSTRFMEPVDDEGNPVLHQGLAKIQQASHLHVGQALASEELLLSSYPPWRLGESRKKYDSEKRAG